MGNFNDAYCRRDVLSCRWQKNAVEINADIDKITSSKYVFLDPLIGYEGKWYIHQEVLKYDYLSNFINNLDNNDTAVIVMYKDRAKELISINDWQKINDYDSFSAYKKLLK
ncbi:MAG: hypothetical protein COU81_03870 [Candidatus Portnoybacteria bacterium CG10_big_fil_rev_8_21_14_0_10_36_7]|uniref:Uncharacterized protein n=1 Tax=Candidatus Portnoybacteria bacterium CG10_big_fil_rev_8_21_14_0_10_36_7 TaxID=1974812 RepID=A0A2M8KD60_9BACT|nr:MAG: hypothetical protein COU81_03870 [Candidatus Portnoybacteria bacterium CG10_big_fil_rev_8_21_14_0_10_36_7]